MAERPELRRTNLGCHFPAIIAFLLLFGTFAIGLRCFADFDKGLLRSKLHGKDYKQVNGGASQSLFGDFSLIQKLPVRAVTHHLPLEPQARRRRTAGTARGRRLARGCR